MQVWRKWSIRPDNGTRNVLSAAHAKILLEQNPSFLRNTKSIVQNAMKISLLPNVSNVLRWVPCQFLFTQTSKQTLRKLDIRIDAFDLFQVITQGGVTYRNEPWHRECFTCTNCSKSLAGQRFTSRDDKPYCADCFGELFSKRCTACSKPITGMFKH